MPNMIEDKPRSDNDSPTAKSKNRSPTRGDVVQKTQPSISIVTESNTTQDQAGNLRRTLESRRKRPVIVEK